MKELLMRLCAVRSPVEDFALAYIVVLGNLTYVETYSSLITCYLLTSTRIVYHRPLSKSLEVYRTLLSETHIIFRTARCSECPIIRRTIPFLFATSTGPEAPPKNLHCWQA